MAAVTVRQLSREQATRNSIMMKHQFLLQSEPQLSCSARASTIVSSSSADDLQMARNLLRSLRRASLAAFIVSFDATGERQWSIK
jgi:hypothetical protein